MNIPPKKIAQLVLCWQLALTLTCALLVWIFSTWPNSYSVLLGGLASFVPSAIFALILLRKTHASQAKQIVIALFAGEFIKLILSGVLLVIMIMLLPVKLLPLVAGFLVATLGFWVAPLTKINHI